MRLAILGGSFDPPHIGHLHAAESARSSGGYDTVAFVPALISPFKTGRRTAPASCRKTMVELAAAENPHFYCEDFEVHQNAPSYTINTIEFLYKKFRTRLTRPIGLIIGDDHLSRLSAWYKADQLFSQVDVVVAKRYGVNYTDTACTKNIRYLDEPPLDISSTQIRKNIAEKKAWRYLVHSSTYRYIIEHKIYEQD